MCLSIREQRISAVIGFSNASTAPKNESRNKNFNEFLNLPNAVSKKIQEKKKIILNPKLSKRNLPLALGKDLSVRSR
jgi:hypothetical protein